MDTSKDHFYNLFLSLNKDLFSLTLNDKLIINDKDGVAAEVLSMLTTNELFGINLDYLTMGDVSPYPFNIKPISTKDKQIKSSLMFNIKLTQILNLIFSLEEDGIPIMSSKKTRLLVETGIRQHYEKIIHYLTTKNNSNQIIWDQPIFDETRKEIKDEIFRARYKPKGAKISGKLCMRCKSEELYFNMRQTRSGDEPMTTFFKCTACGYEWTVR